MSLVGNLEDLGLGDILQIVSLSRKSGVLSLNSRNRDGKIFFLNGQVIRAASSVYRENLGHLLLRKDLVDLATLKKALAHQQNATAPERLGAILAERFKVPREAIEAAVKEQVEKIVYSFFGWTEGSFAFELGDQDAQGSTSLNPLQFMLDQGLNPQWLAMEGSRIIDELRHRDEPVEETPDPAVDLESLLEDFAGAEPADPGSGEPDEEPELIPELTEAGASGITILLLDDDEITRQKLTKVLDDRGFQVTSFSSGQDFLSTLADLVGRGEAPAVLIDLIMPRMDGSGILGGLEILEELRRNFPDLQALVLTDHPNQDAEGKVRGLGYTEILPKPKKDALRSADGVKKLLRLADLIADRFGTVTPLRSESGAQELHHFGRELLAEIGEQDPSALSPKGPESPGLHLLKGMLQELNNPSLGGGIILLVLRFASELMNRAVILLAKENDIVGLGQFGIEINGEAADERIRRMRIPRRSDSILARALEEQVPLRATLSDSQWDRYLRDNLGGGEPREVFVGPILSEGHVVALIYGDNLPHQEPIGDTESFEIFLSQAGLAMEKALLERRLKSKAAI